jgi:hypothetical protein
VPITSNSASNECMNADAGPRMFSLAVVLACSAAAFPYFVSALRALCFTLGASSAHLLFIGTLAKVT